VDEKRSVLQCKYLPENGENLFGTRCFDRDNTDLNLVPVTAARKAVAKNKIRYIIALLIHIANNVERNKLVTERLEREKRGVNDK